MPGNEMLDIRIGVNCVTPEISMEIDQTRRDVSIELDLWGPEYEDYTGPYHVAPTFYFQQLLETNGKHMTDNVVVDSVKVTESLNPQGGRTVVIG